MTSKLTAAVVGALLVLPMYAHAQQSRPLPDPADPAVAVPPTVYEPLISRPSSAPQDGQPTPDKSWRAANDAVGGASNHAGHDGHAGHGGHGAEQHHQGHAAAPARSAPATPAKPADPAPVDHSKHH